MPPNRRLRESALRPAPLRRSKDPLELPLAILEEAVRAIPREFCWRRAELPFVSGTRATAAPSPGPNRSSLVATKRCARAITRSQRFRPRNAARLDDVPKRIPKADAARAAEQPVPQIH